MDAVYNKPGIVWELTKQKIKVMGLSKILEGDKSPFTHQTMYEFIATEFYDLHDRCGDLMTLAGEDVWGMFTELSNRYYILKDRFEYCYCTVEDDLSEDVSYTVEDMDRDGVQYCKDMIEVLDGYIKELSE